MKRVLMVTPVWPPLGAIGVRRVVRLARHLPASGWTPVVLTDTPTGSGKVRPPHIDPSLAPPPVEVHHAAGVMVGARIRRNLSDLLGLLGGRASHLFLRATAESSTTRTLTAIHTPKQVRGQLTNAPENQTRRA